jgi:exodeoxyribonuclease-3
MTYNIRTGGRDRRGDRLDAIIEVLAGVAPDVLALQELDGFTPDGERMRRVAAALRMRPVMGRSLIGRPVAVLVREPARIQEGGTLVGPFHHAAARAVVDTDRGPLTVIGAHLCPFSSRHRLWEARWLVRRARPADDGLVLLMGDLNSLDPWTDHAHRLRRLPLRYRVRHLRWGRVDTRAVARLAAGGFVDLFRHAGTGSELTVPTAYAGREFSGMRVDYALGSAPVAARAVSCRVVIGGPAESASDHYPVVAELDLTLRRPPT